MARPNEKLLKHWRTQMEYADLVWEEAGWKQSARIESVQSNELAVRYLNAYRGQQWTSAGWMGLAPEALAVTPLFFSVANTFVAGLLARSPEITVLPRRPSVAESARKVEALLNYDVYELKMKRQWARTVLDAFFCPFGLTRHGFTPSEEFTGKSDEELLQTYAGARKDKPWIRRWTLWDFRLDPTAETPDSDGDARWCAFRTLMTKEEIERTQGMVLPKDAKSTVRVSLPTPQGQKRSRTRAAPAEYYEVWSVYDKTDRTWVQLDGSYEHILRPQADWPIPWEDLPYDALYFNPQSDTLFPIPYAQTIFGTIEMRNKLRTLMEELTKRLRRIIAYNKNALAEGEEAKLETLDLQEWVATNGDLANAIKEIQVGGFPQELMLFDSLLKEDVREALGQSNMDRAQRVNVESATEAANIAQGSAQAQSRNVQALEDWLDSCVRHYAQARRAVTVESEVVPLGLSDPRQLNTRLPEDRFLNVTPQDLHAEYDFIIKQGSTLPDTRRQRITQALANLQVASQQPQLHNLQALYADYWIAAGESPAEKMLTSEQIAATQQPQIPGEEPEIADTSQLIGQLGQAGVQ